MRIEFAQRLKHATTRLTQASHKSIFWETFALEFICPNGHKHSISWDKWKNGERCIFCNKPVLQGIDFIRRKFEKEGYQLLSDIYIDCKTKLEFICPSNHRYSISWNKWQQGRRCGKCAKNKKKSLSFIKSEFAKAGYILLDTKYKDNLTIEEGKEIIKKAITSSIIRDMASGNGIDLAVIRKEGKAEREFIPI